MYTEHYQKARDFTQNSALFCRSVAEEVFEIAGENLTRISNQMKRLTEVRKPEDFLNLQRECMEENIAAISKNTEKLMHLYAGRLEEWTKNCEACHKEVKTKVKETVDHALHAIHPHTVKTKKHNRSKSKND